MVIRSRPRPSYFKRKWNRFKSDYDCLGLWYAVSNNITHNFTIFFRRIFRPGNVIVVKTLDRGYCEPQDLIFHGMFQVLVNFVDREWIGSGYNGKLFNIMEENQRLIDGGWDEEHRKSQIDQIEDQNRRTTEIWTLYNWWKTERKLRYEKEPKYEFEDYDPHRFVAVLDKDGKDTTMSTLEKNNDDPIKLAAWEAHMKEWSAFDDKCDKEDEDMFFRLIHIRESLWT